MNTHTSATTAFILSVSMMAAAVANAQGINSARGREDDGNWQGNDAPTRGCRELPSHEQLRQALSAARAQANGGLNLDMWGTIVDRDGVVCAVAFTGADRGDQWPGSRVISAQKASTANAFSLPGLSLSTANLYTATQPGGSLFGLQDSNPVATDVAYSGHPGRYGQRNDPMVGSTDRRRECVRGRPGALRRQRRESWAGLASAATRHAPTTTSRIAPATCWSSTTCRLACQLIRSEGTTSSSTSLRNRTVCRQSGQMSGISGINLVANPGGFGHPSCHSATACWETRPAGALPIRCLPIGNKAQGSRLNPNTHGCRLVPCDLRFVR